MTGRKPSWRWFLDPRFAGAVVAIALALASGVTRLEADNTIARWLRESERERQDSSQFKALFGSDDFILLMIEDAVLPDPDLKQRVEEFRRQVGQEAGVSFLFSPLDLQFPVQEKGVSGPRPEPPGILNLLWNSSNKALGLLLFPDQTGFSREDVHLINQSARDCFPQREWRLAGPAVFNDALSQLGEDNQKRLYPWVAVFLAIGIWLAFRSTGLVLIALLSVVLCLAATFGLAGWSGVKVDLISGALPPLLMVICLTSSIHLLKAWQRCGGGKGSYGLARAIRETFTPALLAAVTTGVGFGSFMTSDIPALAGMGLLAPCGVILSWLIAYSLPVLFLKIPGFECPASTSIPGPVSPSPSSDVTAKKETSYQALVSRELVLIRADGRARRRLSAFAILVGASFTMLGWLSFESNPLLFFPAQSPIAVSYHEIENRLVGLSPIEIVLDRAACIPDKVPFVLERLKKIPLIQGSLSAGDLLMGSPPIPLAGGEPLASKYTDPGGGFERITLFAKTIDSGSYQDLLARVEETLSGGFGSREGFSITGIVPTILRAQEYLLRSQAQGLITATLIIFLLTVVGLRAVWPSLLFMAPNVAPVVVLLALLVLAGVSLDVGTIMVANVTLGIAVDDTYHFMWMYGRARKSGLGRYSAIYKARGQVQSPMVGATAVNSVGFLVLIFSTFPPMRIFGILVAAGLWLALAAEWFLMPPLMVVCRPRIKVSE